MTGPHPPVAADTPRGASAAFVVWCVGILLVLGAVLGLLGALLIPVSWHVFGAALPVAWGVALVNFTAGRLAQGSLERWWAPVLPFAGWVGVVGPMALLSPGGDKIFVYDNTSLGYVALGLLAFAATIGTSATPRGMTGR